MGAVGDCDVVGENAGLGVGAVGDCDVVGEYVG